VLNKCPAVGWVQQVLSTLSRMSGGKDKGGRGGYKRKAEFAREGDRSDERLRHSNGKENVQTSSNQIRRGTA